MLIMKNYNDVTLKYYVYQLLKLDGSPFYIGKGSGNRLMHHFTNRSMLKESLKNSIIHEIKKQTGSWPQVEKICESINAKTAFMLEKSLIKKYGRLDKGTGILANITDGGGRETGWIMPIEVKQKISNALRGRSRNVTWGDAISSAKKGINHSAQHKHNLSLANKQRKGKKMHEIYNEQDAIRLRALAAKNMMKSGMTWEDRYGTEGAAKLREKRALLKGKTWQLIDGKRTWCVA